MRHSSAVHLLRSGVEITTISQWLGHASVATTNRYATVDLEMKRKAIEQARPTNFGSDGPAQWRTDASILDCWKGFEPSWMAFVMWNSELQIARTAWRGVRDSTFLISQH